MRFLADESCDAVIIRALQDARHDVKSVSNSMRGAADRLVLRAALHERRLLLTEDKDFGELVFSAGVPAIGVVLLRYPPAARTHLVRKLIDFVATRPEQVTGSFVVISPARTRIRPIPRG